MGRRPKSQQPTSDAPSPPRQVHVIHPSAVYSTDEARTILRLKGSSLRREIREGRLTVAKRCGRYYFLGSMLLDWLQAGVIRRQRGPAAPPARRGTKIPTTPKQEATLFPAEEANSEG